MCVMNPTIHNRDQWVSLFLVFSRHEPRSFHIQCHIMVGVCFCCPSCGEGSWGTEGEGVMTRVRSGLFPLTNENFTIWPSTALTVIPFNADSTAENHCTQAYFTSISTSPLYPGRSLPTHVTDTERLFTVQKDFLSRASRFQVNPNLPAPFHDLWYTQTEVLQSLSSPSDLSLSFLRPDMWKCQSDFIQIN